MATDAVIGVAVKKEPFLWLWDVVYLLGSGAGEVNVRIYEALAGEKLLMAKMWMDTPVAVKQFKFYKGDDDTTTEISHTLLTTNIPSIDNDSEAFDPTKPHLKILIGGDASEDFMVKWIAGGDETYTAHFQLFFET